MGWSRAGRQTAYSTGKRSIVQQSFEPGKLPDFSRACAIPRASYCCGCRRTGILSAASQLKLLFRWQKTTENELLGYTSSGYGTPLARPGMGRLSGCRGAAAARRADDRRIPPQPRRMIRMLLAVWPMLVGEVARCLMVCLRSCRRAAGQQNVLLKPAVPPSAAAAYNQRWCRDGVWFVRRVQGHAAGSEAPALRHCRVSRRGETV